MYERFLNGVDFINLEFGRMLSAGCVLDLDFHDHLLLSTLLPIAVLTIPWLNYLIVKRRNQDMSQEALDQVSLKHVSVALLVIFRVYSSLSSTVFRTFACDKLDDGRDFLRADYRLTCDSPKHRGLMVFAGIMIVVYPVGNPVAYFVVLFRKRDLLLEGDKQKRSEDTYL
ncbi:unnamed protein product [Discosporangium mesarthrocarpum]